MRKHARKSEWEMRFHKLSPEKKSIISKQKLKNLACLYIHNIQDKVNTITLIVNLKTMKAVPPTEELIYLLSHVPHKWDVQIMALGRSWDGKEYIKSEGYQIGEPLLQSQLADSLGAIHYKFFLDKIPASQRINMAWLGVPKGADVILNDDLFLTNLLHEHKAFFSTGKLEDGRNYAD